MDFRPTFWEKFEHTNTLTHTHTHTHTHTQTHWAPPGATAGTFQTEGCEKGESESAGVLKLQHTNSCLMRMICSKAAWTSSSMWPYETKVKNELQWFNLCNRWLEEAAPDTHKHCLSHHQLTLTTHIIVMIIQCMKKLLKAAFNIWSQQK